MNHIEFMFNYVFLFGFCLFVFSACTGTSDKQLTKESPFYNEADKRKIRIISALQKLQEMPLELDKNSQSAYTRKIKNVVDDFDKLNTGDEEEKAADIASLALLSRNLSRHCFDMDCFKESNLRPTYEHAYWIIVEKLAKDKQRNTRVLEHLKTDSHLGDVDAGTWGNIVDGIKFP